MKNKKFLCEPTSNLTLDPKLFGLFEMQSICPKHKKHLSSFNEVTLKIKETLFQTALVLVLVSSLRKNTKPYMSTLFEQELREMERKIVQQAADIRMYRGCAEFESESR